MDAVAVADKVLSLYIRYGQNDYIGEPVSQIEHMCQCAQLAEDAGYEDDIILAAFFHDIGHLLESETDTEQMDGYGVVDHEKLGAAYLLQKGFSGKISKLVASHVVAKRYLTFKYPEYRAKLSEASTKTLAFQGGPMNEAEAAVFEADPLHKLYIQLRLWDEQAKLEDIALPPMEHYRQKMMAHLDMQYNKTKNLQA
jgi:2-amino-1-hydroxyethylphosphonate dioxygenase (glycine-forming)